MKNRIVSAKGKPDASTAVNPAKPPRAGISHLSRWRTQSRLKPRTKLITINIRPYVSDTNSAAPHRGQWKSSQKTPLSNAIFKLHFAHLILGTARVVLLTARVSVRISGVQPACRSALPGKSGNREKEDRVFPVMYRQTIASEQRIHLSNIARRTSTPDAPPARSLTLSPIPESPPESASPHPPDSPLASPAAQSPENSRHRESPQPA